MTPYEIMLSESQERMLIVLENGKEEQAKEIFDKWNLDFAIIGKTTNSKKIEIFFCIPILQPLLLPQVNNDTKDFAHLVLKSLLS